MTSGGVALPGWVNAVRVPILVLPEDLLLQVQALTYCQSCCTATSAAAGWWAARELVPTARGHELIVGVASA